MQKKIENIVVQAVKEYAAQSQNRLVGNPDTDTPLYGTRSSIDSIGLVTIIVAVEQAVADEFDINITLADEKAMSLKNSPFLTVGTLRSYIQILIGGDNHDR